MIWDNEEINDTEETLTKEYLEETVGEERATSNKLRLPRLSKRELAMVFLAIASVLMLVTVGFMNVKTQAKLRLVQEELEEAVTVNMETYLTQSVPAYVVGTIEAEREAPQFTKEQTMEMAQTVRQTLAEDITREVLSGRDELDEEKIREMEEKLTVSVREKLAQMEIMTKEGIPVKGEDYFTREEMEAISKGAADLVKIDLSQTLEQVAAHTEGIERAFVKQETLESNLNAVQHNLQGRIDSLEADHAKERLDLLERVGADGRLEVLEKTHSGERLEELEGIHSKERLEVLEAVNSKERLDHLEELNTAERLNLLEQAHAETRIEALENVHAAERLSSLETQNANERLQNLENDQSLLEKRVNQLEDHHVASRLDALEGHLGIGEGAIAGDHGSIQNKLTALENQIEEMNQSFQAGCDRIMAACTAIGITPAGNSAEQIAQAIQTATMAAERLNGGNYKKFGSNGTFGTGPWKLYPQTEGQKYLLVYCTFQSMAQTPLGKCEIRVSGVKEGQTQTLLYRYAQVGPGEACLLLERETLVDVEGYSSIEISAWCEENMRCNGECITLY